MYCLELHARCTLIPQRCLPKNRGQLGQSHWGWLWDFCNRFCSWPSLQLCFLKIFHNLIFFCKNKNLNIFRLMLVGEVVNAAIPSPAWTAPQPCPLLQIVISPHWVVIFQSGQEASWRPRLCFCLSVLSLKKKTMDRNLNPPWEERERERNPLSVALNFSSSGVLIVFIKELWSGHGVKTTLDTNTKPLILCWKGLPQ